MAGHITEAVQLAQSLQFDLYMIELFFIDGSGFDLIHALRQFDASTPIVVCSGDGRDSVREAVRQVGVEIVLVKPIGVEMLVQVVAQVLDDRPLCS